MLIFVTHFTKSKLITRSVPVLKFPEKKTLFPLLGTYLLLRNQVSAENIHKSISINNTQLTTFYCNSATISIANLSNTQLFFTKFNRGHHPVVYPIPTLIPSPLQNQSIKQSMNQSKFIHDKRNIYNQI